MSSFSDIPWDEGQEDPIAPEGRYTFRIAGGEDKMTKAKEDAQGNPKPQRRMIECVLTIEGASEDYAPVMYWLVFPNPDEWDDEDSKRTAKMMTRNANRFFRVFGINPQEFDGINTILGSTGECNLAHKMVDGELRTELRLPRME